MAADVRMRARDFSNALNVQIGYPEYGPDVVFSPNVSGGVTVEYRFRLAGKIAYDLFVDYASAEPRACEIIFNEESVTREACNSVTGGWTPAFRKNEYQCKLIGGPPGWQRLKLRRDSGPIPHLHFISLVPLPVG